MGRGPKAGYRRRAAKPQACGDSTRRQAGSSIAVPPRPKAHRSRRDPGTKKTAAEIRAGMARRRFSEILPSGPPVKRECRLSPDTFPPIREKVALRRRPAVAASRRAKARFTEGFSASTVDMPGFGPVDLERLPTGLNRQGGRGSRVGDRFGQSTTRVDVAVPPCDGAGTALAGGFSE
jgi:hypothetical protein